MIIHLTIWWLWWALIAIYVIGVVFGLAMSAFTPGPPWWERPAIIAWPVAFIVIVAWHFALFLAGKE